MGLGSEYNWDLSDLYLKQKNILNYLSDCCNIVCFDNGCSTFKHLVSFFKIEN